jgi:hypothetical protein
MSLTLFTGIAELDAQIFSNVDDIVSLRNLYRTSISFQTYMDSTLVFNSTKNRLKTSYKTDLLGVFSVDEMINKILPIHYVRVMGKHSFCAFLLKQNRFDLVDKFFNKRKNRLALPRYAFPDLYAIYNGNRITFSFEKEKTYYGLMKHLAKKELLTEMKTLSTHIDFTKKLAKRLCLELSGHSENLNFTFSDGIVITGDGIVVPGDGIVVPRKRTVTLTHNILEYLIDIFPSLFNESDLISSVSHSSNIIVHKILRNNIEWDRLYPIVKQTFIRSEDLHQAVCLLTEYPELYFDEKIIEHVVTIDKIRSVKLFNKSLFDESCYRIYMNPVFGNRSIFLQQSKLNNNILNYWHVHHPDKHFWYYKLAQEGATRLALYDKRSDIINFMQNNPNCSPKKVFEIWSSFVYKYKFTTSHQDQKQLLHRKYPQTNHLHERQQIKSKRLHYNQPTSHKHQCRNYHKQNST